MPPVSLTVDGSLVAADAAARTLTYRLLPFGETGRTNRGAVTVRAGVVRLPDTPGAVVLNLEHDPTRPVGRATSIVEDPTGLVATFAIADTTAGRDLVAEAAAGIRTGVSVELDDVVIRDGALTAGALTGAGAVVAPAFPSAQLVASDTPDDEATPTPDDAVVEETPADAPVDDTPEESPMPDTQNLEAGAAPAAAPGTLAAAAPARPALTLPRVASLLAAAGRGDRSPELMAALSDITQTGVGVDVAAPAFIDEVWSGVQYERQIVPLLAPGSLTSYKVVGWRWTTKPVGATYSGDKTAVPSNAAATEPVEYEADRWAGAHDVDRKFRDFGDESFWASYWQAMAASYAKWSDAAAVTGIVAAAQTATPGGYGVVAAIVAAALEVMGTGTPSYCLLGATAFAELVERDPLAFLTGSVSLADGSGNVGGLAFRHHAGIADGDVVVGVRNAASWYELGSTPIRVEAVNVANGGIDVGAFGYGVLGVHDDTGIAKATVTHAP
jgi:hypothetical protein